MRKLECRQFSQFNNIFMLAPQNTLLNTKGKSKINSGQIKNPKKLFGLDNLMSLSSKLQVFH